MLSSPHMLRAALLLIPALTLLSSAALAQPALGGRPFGTDDDPLPGARAPRQRVIMRLDYLRAPGAEACPGEQGFRDAVGAQVRRWEPFAPNGPWHLTVIVSRRGDGYEGSVELRDVTGAVELQRAYPATPRCLDLLGDLARAVALKVDPPTPPPSVAPVLLPPAQPPERSPAQPSPTKAPSIRLGVGTWMDLATAPRPAFGLSVDVGVRVHWFSIAAEGRWDPPAGGTVKDGVDVSTARILGAIVPCAHVGWFAGCLLGELGQIRGSVSAPSATPDHQAGLYLAGGVRVAAEIPVAPHLLVRLAADLTGSRPAAFWIDGARAWETASFTAGLGAGLVAFF